MELHVITNGDMLLEHWERIPQFINEIDFLHIREQSKTANELFTIVNMLLEKGVPANKVIINDRLDLALVMDVYGIQLGYRSIPLSVVTQKQIFEHLQVGKSVHDVEEAIRAEDEGADYLLFGHVFSTNSKKGLPPRGVQSLHAVVQSVDIPVVAIGGITPLNVGEVVANGAKGIAIMSPIWNTKNPLQLINEYRNASHL
ncbi:thiazole tautomerase (transcriptional regulator TenI) [Gracilibacillus halotolerans]|uniref:Thiazole tautomerase (Transcriptional regulator TenI) n=1 Tax=Gracilibacillus halotolerans TaxID=74386 RepID=A0A841RNZ0_9BACI|nr:thiamine phosphate synthase [Gracilibacillus halotolerans]MBB6512654.1 thiazole tautomerase (transcriptional regulator TenI) [Gracilibacillus halotolerans]